MFSIEFAAIKNFLGVNNKEIMKKLDHMHRVVELLRKEVCTMNKKNDAIVAEIVKGPEAQGEDVLAKILRLRCSIN